MGVAVYKAKVEDHFAEGLGHEPRDGSRLEPEARYSAQICDHAAVHVLHG